MVVWHHQFNGHELGQTLGDGEGQGSLACYSPWGHKQSDTTCRLNNNSKELGMTERLTLTYLVSERVGTTLIYQKLSGSMSVPSASPILLYKS